MTITRKVPKTSGYRLFIAEVVRAINKPAESDTLALLDGRAGKLCFDLLPSKTVRAMGAFFTPSPMAAKVVAHLLKIDASKMVAFDPACGAGDLLLPLAALLPVARTASGTMRIWNEHLFGRDLSPEFVRAARLRLLLLALNRGVRLDGTPASVANILSNIVAGDGLSDMRPYRSATHIVMNPPFGIVKTPKATEWRQGSVTAAALFVDRALEWCSPKTRIAAILPEVLRTGTSYRQWRERVASRSAASRVMSLGLFSTNADVDVFLTRLIVQKARPKRAVKGPGNRSSTVRISDKFSVTVGPVVPHRHGLKGPPRAFLHAGNATAWKTIKRINDSRRFNGKLHKPPFVVIRRTSRPGDYNRAIASLVLGTRPVAVENHLLVARPLRGGIPLCQELVRLLRSRAVNRTLDRTMRCRHLTTLCVSRLTWV